jgi:hypothetical protein
MDMELYTQFVSHRVIHDPLGLGRQPMTPILIGSRLNRSKVLVKG